MDTVQLKVLGGFLFLLVALLFGWTPLILLRYMKSDVNRSTSFLTQHLHALASGVLLATCLLHLLPESVQAVHEALTEGRRVPGRPSFDSTGNSSQVLSILSSNSNEDNNVIDNGGLYPIAELMLALGFLFIFCVDSIMKTWHSAEEHIEVEETELDIVSGRHGDKYLSKDGFAPGQLKLKGDSSTEKLISTSNNGQPSVSDYQVTHNGKDFSDDEEESLRQISGFHMLSRKEFTESDEAHPLAERQQSDKLAKAKPAAIRVRSLALVAALCIHGFFDGVMLGLQTSENVLLSLMLALSLHKSFVSVSLSLTLSNNAQTETTKSYSTPRPIVTEMLYVLVFASVAPLGLILSSVFVHTALDLTLGTNADASRDVSALPGCLQAFAVGTFLYVTFSELAEHSKQTEVIHSDKRRKLVIRTLINHVFLLIGFSSMAGLRAALG
ncbi:zinc transporter ZIP3-like [Elysia marginata]|uniref:Zinc transporter ZIP3-like n=1 Tax=Elysia marginata TaxID=1093978 RepID=A0AAV4HGD5_9GAST|nr:zinc transporter ZIP3-like [Elysia marginata]